jgi:homoserine dehydrogenase
MHYKLALVGFGNVGKAFARLLLRKREALERQFGLTFSVTGIATAHHGIAIQPNGIALEDILKLAEQGDLHLEEHSAWPVNSVDDFVRSVPADVLFENSPVNHESGQPAIEYLRVALSRGMHAVTANKGPLVHAYRELTSLAGQVGKRFMFESSVMDGAPIFSLFRGPLPLAELRGFMGILNSCTNLLLERMESGESFEQAVQYAQSIGIAETDPSADIDGWDAAIKVAALSTVLIGVALLPQQVAREGNSLLAQVKPEQVEATSPLYAIGGTSSYVQFELDTLPGLGIVEGNPGPETTAYGLLADFINAIRGA